MRQFISFAALVLLASSFVAAQQPTIADAQADFDKGEYRPSLQKISSILNSPSAQPGTPQRYDLLMLRGECLLQLKEPVGAANSFDSAGLAIKGDGDVKKLSAARALAMLIRESPGMAYKPKTRSASEGGGASGAAEAINIVPPDSRKRALLAMLDDRIAALKPQIEQAAAGTSLVPMEKLLPALRDMYAIELTATGEAARTIPLAQTLGDRARELITAELDRIGKRTAELRDLANETTFSNEGRNNGTIGNRGLTSPERDEIKSMAQTLMQIEKVAQEGRRINRRIGGTGQAWDEILAQTTECKEQAQAAYDRRY